MAIDVATKDCTALSDAELAELADMCTGGPAGYEIGVLSKYREDWVLVTQARDNGKLHGFAFCTLERIGGTPCLLMGIGSVKRTSKRETVLKALMNNMYRRAVMAFPDEDVVVGTKLIDAGAFNAFKGLTDVCPQPEHRTTGEERAWSRRLAKRFGAEGRIDDRTFVVTGDNTTPGVFDHESLKPETIKADVAAYFTLLDHDRGDYLIAFGWAMAEDLAGNKLPR
ncbi:MAG TPA: hypothetical protein VMZ22_04820 [Acidimicrobiales bacterium]|nr:hypothetical protein [Acidimicrobiales bacterium]